jgi:hypothetical protein
MHNAVLEIEIIFFSIYIYLFFFQTLTFINIARCHPLAQTSLYVHIEDIIDICRRILRRFMIYLLSVKPACMVKIRCEEVLWKYLSNSFEFI